MAIKGLVKNQTMRIKFKNAVIIWSILAVSLVGKDIVAEHTDYLDNASIKVPDKNEYPFIVDVSPMDAKIMVMNIAPKYTKGMILPKGEYDIKVSKYGYKSERIWVKHTDDTPHIIRLKKRG